MALLLNSPARVFLHYFDTHFLELKLSRLHDREVRREARGATRLAMLYGDEVLVPAASYFESGICRAIVSEFETIFDTGVLWLVGGAANLEEFVYRKLRQYDKESTQYQSYSGADWTSVPPFRSRLGSATMDIRRAWIGRLDSAEPVTSIASNTFYAVPEDFERRWERVPEELGERAFIVPYIAPMLLGEDRHPTLLNRLRGIVNEEYFRSYTEELDAATVGELVYLESPHVVPSQGPPIPYRRFLQAAREERFLRDFLAIPGRDLLSLKEDERWVRCRISIQQSHLNREGIAVEKKESGMGQVPKPRCFIAHGHDDALKFELKDFLQNSLSLPEPIILEQKANRGRTIIEKFEECVRDIDVAFVLLTPDDLGGAASSDEVRERARQNVIFELGYFAGAFGRKSGRVILLHRGELEVPSDMAGVIYIDVNNGVKAAGEDIRRELEEL